MTLSMYSFVEIGTDRAASAELQWGNVATELVVRNIKNSKGWRAAAEGGSTCKGLSDTDGSNSFRSPSMRLKLTSRTTMLSEDISSAGRPPERELYDRLRRDKAVSSPSNGEI
uniref:Uncharacterized protein n=1 Tax=Leersia perrieri TaxID=77586 RepID=A0A0D9VCD0_9ORYZ